jgi:hypothetical protein
MKRETMKLIARIGEVARIAQDVARELDETARDLKQLIEAGEWPNSTVSPPRPSRRNKKP